MPKIKQGIVICHHPDNKPFLDDLLKSIDKTEYPIFVCEDGIDRPENSFELGAIEEGSKYFEQFVFLQDSCVIKDISLFDKLFAIKGNVALTPKFFHYMGKLSELPDEFPKVNDKEGSIRFETTWLKLPYTSFEPELPVESKVFEEKYGRLNMVLENQYLIKYKARWQ